MKVVGVGVGAVGVGASSLPIDEGPGRLRHAARFGHGGSNEGFRCEMVGFLAGGKGAVVMTNGDRGGALAAEILRSIGAA